MEVTITLYSGVADMNLGQAFGCIDGKDFCVFSSPPGDFQMNVFEQDMTIFSQIVI
jgi:hypothetical protein